MYKKQMKFQKLICFATLIASAILFIYSLGLVTDLYDAFYETMRDHTKIYDLRFTKVEGAWIFYEIQPFNMELTTAAIILLGCSLLPFISNTHSRRKYYIANYITVGISCVANVAVAIWCASNVAKFREQFLTTVNFEQLKEYAEKWKSLYTESTFWFDIGFVICTLLILVTALNIYNLIWKTKLMKDEKRLITEGLEG